MNIQEKLCIKLAIYKEHFSFLIFGTVNTICCMYSNCLLIINSYCIRNMYRIDY